jgi:hypothetical protein
MNTPTSTPTSTIPAGYRQDAQGRLVPLAHIKPVDLLRDTLVTEIVAKAKAANATLAELRRSAYADIQAFAELSAERFGVTLGGKKGNLTLVSFDGRYRIQRAISDQLVFDESLQAAKALIDDCLREWAKDARPEIHTLITDAFQVDKQGRIDTDRVLSLRRLDIKDERWQRAMEAISASLSVASSRSYIRVYERVGESDAYRQINLDLANA